MIFRVWEEDLRLSDEYNCSMKMDGYRLDMKLPDAVLNDPELLEIYKQWMMTIIDANR